MNRTFPRNLPLGGVGLLAIVSAAAVLFGQFNVYGLEFLAFWRLLLGGSLAVFTVFMAIWGTVIAYNVWSGRAWWMLSRARWGEYFAVAALLALLGLCWLEHREYQCLLVSSPVLGLAVFAIAVYLQDPIVSPIRQAGRERAAFAVLLCLHAVMMFLMAELFALDHYRKGLVHYRNDRWAVSSILSSDRVEFFYNFAQKEIVLKTADSGTVLAHRPIPVFDCD
jgi:hypothetical protein